MALQPHVKPSTKESKEISCSILTGAIIATIFCFGVSATSSAQELFEGYRIPVTTHVLEVTQDTLSIDRVMEHHNRMFYATDSLGRTNSGYVYWFRLDFGNQLAKFYPSDTIYLVTGVLDKAELFYHDSGIKRLSLDYASRENYHKHTFTSSTIPLGTDKLIDGRYIFLKVVFTRGWPNLRGITFRYNTVAAEKVHGNFISVPAVQDQITFFIFLGVAGLLLIFNLLLYYNSRDKQYLFYSAFLLFQVVYYSRGTYFIGHYLFYNYYFLNFLSTEMAQVAANLSYLFFVKYFLETRLTLPFLDKVINVVVIVLTLFIITDTILLVINPFFPYQPYLMYTHRYFMSAFAVLGVLYLILNAKGNLRLFIIAGTICYTGGALTTMFLGKLKFMVMGSALENIIFALGLSYKIGEISREKLRVERETNQVRLSALRAQMNPHFIFNSLNSIQHLISKNDKVHALKYLSKFSILLRQILESSIHVNNPIKSEIDLLKIYLELESLRFDHSFQYDIEVDESLDVHNLELPLLLLQPYVENAISHGLLPKQEGTKKLTISFSDHGNFVLCCIHDTGIGRKAAMERKQNLKLTRPSRGMALTQQRIALLNTEFNSDDLITIEDSDAGTTVKIRIPKN